MDIVALHLTDHFNLWKTGVNEVSNKFITISYAINEERKSIEYALIMSYFRYKDKIIIPKKYSIHSKNICANCSGIYDINHPAIFDRITNDIRALCHRSNRMIHSITYAEELRCVVPYIEPACNGIIRLPPLDKYYDLVYKSTKEDFIIDVKYCNIFRCEHVNIAKVTSILYDNRQWLDMLQMIERHNE